MIEYLRRNPSSVSLADVRELGALQDLGHIGVPPQLVSFSLPGSQVAADEAEGRLMQREADRNATLHHRTV